MIPETRLYLKVFSYGVTACRTVGEFGKSCQNCLAVYCRMMIAVCGALRIECIEYGVYSCFVSGSHRANYIFQHTYDFAGFKLIAFRGTKVLNRIFPRLHSVTDKNGFGMPRSEKGKIDRGSFSTHNKCCYCARCLPSIYLEANPAQVYVGNVFVVR